MKHLLLLIVPLLMLSNENRITQEESFLLEVEYGRMLYKNPRGISCAKCHGKEGKGGEKIAKYYDAQRNPKILKGLNILNYNFKELTNSLKNEYRDKMNKRVKHKIMPIYYLTKEETHAIYTYLQHIKKKNKANRQ